MSTPDDPLRQESTGIGGWLILVAIGLIISPFRILWFLVSTFESVMEPGVWHMLTTPGAERYHPLWQPLLFVELGVNSTFFVLSAVLLYLFYQHDRLFPRFIIGFYIANLIYLVIDHYLGNLIPAVREVSGETPSREVLQTVVASVIWIPYFLVSKRVKATFTL